MGTRIAERAALLVLLAVVGLRPLVSESFRTAGASITTALEGTEDPWALATLIIDAVVLVVAAGVTVRRAAGAPRPYRRCGLEWGAALMAVAAVISCFFAGEKRPAINASLDWIAAIALSLALVQLLDRGWKIRLTLCVIIASGVANAAECAQQRYVSFAETEQMYRAMREQFWTKQGVPLDSPKVRLFEERMRSREASGYFAHSNVAGGYLLLPAFAILGLGLATARAPGRYRRVLLVVVCALPAATLGGAVLLTKSTGALVAGAAGLVLLGGRLRWASWLARKERAVFIGGWLAVVLAVLGTVSVGAARGSLPHPSLDFRWRYWTASAEMFADHWNTGVGAENFGDHYLRYKRVDSPEEVKNPHNFLVQFATEHGIVGLVGAVVMLVGGSRAVTRQGRAQDDPSEPEREASVRPAVMACWVGALALSIFVPRLLLAPSTDAYFLVWVTAFALLPWVVTIVLVLFSCRGLAGGPRAAPDWTAALACGLFAFLLQDVINFALFVPAARTTFFALAAVSVAARAGQTTEPQRARRNAAGWAAAALCSLAAIYTVVTMASPVLAERALRRARAAQELPGDRLQTHPAQLLFAEAARRDRLDATAPAEQARWLLTMASGADTPDQAHERAGMGLQAIKTALDRAPHRFSLWMRQAQLHVLRGQASGDTDEFQAAADAVTRAIELYPTRPESYVRLGDCLLTVGAGEAVAQAIVAYRKALALDDARPAWERFRRFSASTRQAVETRLEEAMSRRMPEGSPAGDEGRP